MTSERRRAHYMLRRTLSLWKPQETIQEVFDYCREFSVGEVIWKIDVEDFSHGLPPHDYVRQYLPWLVRARETLGSTGIFSSINPWVTLNHCDRGRNQRAVHPDIQWMMDASGVEANACACPLSEGFLRWIAETYRLYASTKPHILWLEDDMRTHNHQPVRWGCYCPLHMRALSNAIGRKIGREELVGRLLAPGVPDPVRPVWFRVLGDSMVAVARAVARAVHGGCAETRLGYMCSLAMDGSWWEAALEELSLCGEPVARPCFGPYVEGRPAELVLDNLNFMKDVCCLPAGTRLAPELEDFPYTPYSKSAAVTRLLLEIGQVVGAADITMNLYDHVGTPIRKRDRYGRMLAQVKPLLDALAERCGPGGTPRGVGVPFRRNVRDYVRLREGEGFDQLASDGEGWAAVVQGAGMPAVWDDNQRVICATGRTLSGYTQAEMQAILRRGLLLDASALLTLTEMGYGRFLGVSPGEWISKTDRPLSAEESPEKDFAGAPGTYLTLTGLVRGQRLNLIAPGKGARVISHLVDPDRARVLPAFTVFENELGGRVAIYPFDASQGFAVAFSNWTRKEQLAAIVRWLGKGTLDLCAEDGAWMMPFRRDYPDCVLIAFANLELDDWSEFAFVLEWPAGAKVGALEIAEPSGKWKKVNLPMERKGGELRVQVPGGLPALRLLALTIGRE
ncbi:MAG: hypothetical protein V2A58_00595 [Planctomycetota bacterium]